MQAVMPLYSHMTDKRAKPGNLQSRALSNKGKDWTEQHFRSALYNQQK
jgi:hypothetical protein